ncbi:MAG: gliding motility-associated ABC transporter ATP-binding subunit GldA, partial [Cyclobacteriaceae bacterium]
GQELLTIHIDASKGDVKKELLALKSVETVKDVDGKDLWFTVQSKPDTSSRKEIFDLCVKQKWYLMEMTGIETRLEDVFRNLTN